VQVVGFDAHLSYNIALCYYRLRDFAPALKHIADIIERGIRDHPELSVGMQTEGIEVIRTSHKSSFNELAWPKK
jgi:tetratricopeptide repeat protein 30